ncbi:uncharacterized protein PG998_011592 [Apiospora kogelbergensis]|uniref:uncharacterized protein n=1 Tax=Apiospora kogelbergensis TaxID=1337665 RepID=UPI00312F6F58
MPYTRSAPGAEDDAATEDVSASSAKRRKTRKGTRSCWACKRRKEKCVFNQTIPTQDASCLGCQRRGTRCISQDSPEDPMLPPDGARQMGDRLVKVENIVQQLLNRVRDEDVSPTSHGKQHRTGDILTPALTTSTHVSTVVSDISSPRSNGPRRLTDPSAAYVECRHSRRETRLSTLSQCLHNALPTPEDSDVIVKASYRGFYMFNKAVTISYENLSRQAGSDWVEIARPEPRDHPVLIARYMLQLTHLLQQLQLKFEDPEFHDLQGLSGPPQDMMYCLFDTAISQVSTQDRLVGSIEGLECIMLESTFYANDGKMRLSWTACRRALHLAQLMGLHQSRSRSRYQILDPNSKAEPSALWVRIIHRDRSLSLHLGLPLGCADKMIVSEQMLSLDTPLGRLERLHCGIMGSLLEHKEARSRDLSLAQELDQELQRAARTLPSKWWLTPNFSTPTKHDESSFWDIKRLVLQMSHYNLLNQIHLPYMLRASSDSVYEYSRMACVNASRDILSRFMVLQHFNTIGFCCRTPDFLALMAALTLILAHLQSHQGPSRASNPMIHQYLNDRGMIEQVQESMAKLSRASGDPLSAESADLLRRLLAIEAEAADGRKGRAQGVDVEQLQKDEEGVDDGVVRVVIPYFGVVRIAREGTISKEAPERQPPTDEISSINKEGWPTTAGRITAVHSSTEALPANYPSSNSGQFIESIPNDQTLYSTDYPVQLDLQSQNGFGFTAGPDDWAFQGIDMAFFDSLLSGDVGDDLFQ